MCSELHEKEAKDLSNNIRDLERQKEAAQREADELKTQLKLVEETRDNIRRDLIDANRAIREGKSRNNLIFLQSSTFLLNMCIFWIKYSLKQTNVKNSPKCVFNNVQKLLGFFLHKYFSTSKL